MNILLFSFIYRSFSVEKFIWQRVEFELDFYEIENFLQAHANMTDKP